MRSVPRFILIVVLSFLGGYFFTWWTVAIAGFIVAVLIPLPPLRSFTNGFIAVFLLWLALAFFKDIQNDHILANRMSELILKVRNPVLIGLVSAFVGGLVAGLGALTGSYLRYKRRPLAAIRR